MKVDYYVAGRQTGKTSKLIEQFQNDPNAYIIVNGATLSANDYKLAGFKDRVINASTMSNFMGRKLSTNMKTLLIDEYGYMSAKIKAEVWKIINEHEPDTVVIRTSHLNDIDKDILAAARLINMLPAKESAMAYDIIQRFLDDAKKVLLSDTIKDLISNNNTTVYSII